MASFHLRTSLLRSWPRSCGTDLASSGNLAALSKDANFTRALTFITRISAPTTAVGRICERAQKYPGRHVPIRLCVRLRSNPHDPTRSRLAVFGVRLLGKMSGVSAHEETTSHLTCICLAATCWNRPRLDPSCSRLSRSCCSYNSAEPTVLELKPFSLSWPRNLHDRPPLSSFQILFQSSSRLNQMRHMAKAAEAVKCDWSEIDV